MARNLPEHEDNPIHTDAGAQAQGFPSALVAGVSVYAYLTHPAAAGWGLSWVTRGAAEVRFRSPVLANAALRCVPRTENGEVFVDAQSAAASHAVCQVWRDGVDRPNLRDGERLEDYEVLLDDRWALYGQRCGDSLRLYDDHNLVHPSAWPNLANRITHDQVVDGSWVHTRSRITHLGEAERGQELLVQATIVDRFESRSGQRAVLDVVCSTDRGPVAYVEHEALVRLNR